MIIQNEQEYRATECLMQGFQSNIKHIRNNPLGGTAPEMVEGECRDLQYQVDDFRAQLQTYDDSRRRGTPMRPCSRPAPDGP